MKKKVLCLFLGIWLCLSFALPLYALDGPINADDDVGLVPFMLEESIFPTGAAAVARNLDTEQTYFYRINGNIMSETLSEPGWVPEGASIDSIIGPVDDRSKVEDTTVHPYSAIALILTMYSDDPDDWFYGTATMISPNVALTAAHCLFKRDLGWAKSVLVFPGIYGEMNAPYGVKRATEIAISIPFAEHEISENFDQNTWGASHDWGVIRLESNIDTTCGYLGFQCANSNETNQMSIMISGYPGDLNGYFSESSDQYKHAGTIQNDISTQTTCGNNTTYENRIFSYWIDATAGQSGAPILYNNNGTYQIVGVHSGGYGTVYNKGFGITSQVFYFLLAYKNIS